MSSSYIEAQLKARNAEIGLLLRRAREAAGRTQAECGKLIGVSRQKYNRMENGREEVGVATYERLLAHLTTARNSASTPYEGRAESQHVTIEAQPGQTVHITVRVADGGTQSEGKGIGDTEHGAGS